MNLRDFFIEQCGQLWRSWTSIALWPWPAIVIYNRTGKVTWLDYRHFSKHLKPGDILLCRSDPFILANWAISGTWFKHAAVYTGVQSGWLNENTHFITPQSKCNEAQRQNIQVHTKTAVEAIGQGIELRDLGEVMFHADWVIAVRPWNTEAQQRAIVDTALSKVGLPYNYTFNLMSTNSYYCTELAAMAICAAGLEAPVMRTIPKNIPGLFLPFKRLKTTAWLADDFVVKYTQVARTADTKHIPKELIRG